MGQLIFSFFFFFSSSLWAYDSAASMECRYRPSTNQFLYIKVEPRGLRGHPVHLNLFLNDQLILKKDYVMNLNVKNPKLHFDSLEADILLDVSRPDAHDGDSFNGLFTSKDPFFPFKDSFLYCDYFIEIDPEHK